MKPLYIIPARAGSKGIPGKNTKPLAGVPLVAYSIKAALEVAPVADICVTTDDPEVIDIARSYGLTVPFVRPAELAADTSGSREVMLHALDFYNTHGGDYDTIVLLQPTSPLRIAADISGCLDLMRPGIDMVVSVAEAAANPYYDCFEADTDGLLHIAKGDGLYTRRQDAPKAWQLNGAVYVINAASLRAMPMGKFPRRLMYAMPRERSIDLDTMLDWHLAEAVINSRR